MYTPTSCSTGARRWSNCSTRTVSEPDDRPPARVNELFLTRLPDGGGKLKGRFDDAAMFDAIAAVIDAHAKPLTADDDRCTGERQAEALADVCGYVLDHAPSSVLPDAGGHRPHVNVLIRLDDLENRARAGCLDFGGPVAPESLRMLCCDAAVVPVVLNGKGQPLDVGRATRTIPDGLRRAVAARDRGCAHPGCGRPPSWCEVSSHCEVGARRRDETVEPGDVVQAFITARSIPRNGWCGSATGCRSSSRRSGWIPSRTTPTSPAAPGRGAMSAPLAPSAPSTLARAARHAARGPARTRTRPAHEAARPPGRRPALRGRRVSRRPCGGPGRPGDGSPRCRRTARRCRSRAPWPADRRSHRRSAAAARPPRPGRPRRS